MHPSRQRTEQFRASLLAYYDQHGRHDLPWRLPTAGGFDVYHIVVSELMLQQTQVSRVLVKYAEFLDAFPTVRNLAEASLGEVLIVWQGLGYNRRAKFLWQTAQIVTADYDGIFPDALDGLVRLPGIGRNTAGAVMAYAYNKPALFIETNVRTVYIHEFFADKEGVSDKDVVSVLERTLLPDNPRIFYWALMDYGTHLKKTVGNASVRSLHHVRQSPFEGSKRQVRGAVLRVLADRGYADSELVAAIPDARLSTVLQELVGEGMIAVTDGIYHLA
jgi:A/G-specific adenine glycosylase